MTYNLERYGLQDRNGDGQKDDPKPLDERAAVMVVIAAARPDVLAVQEIGDPTVFEEFRYALRSAGLVYEHSEYLQRGASELNLAVLSRFPLVDRQLHTDDTYSIGTAQIPVLRGFLEVQIQVNPAYRFRLMVAHLKSKVFHQLGQTEMRRNEARLLNKHVRKRLKEEPEVNLLVVGDLNDTFRSAALREVTGEKGEYLADIRPADEVGDVWTHFTPDIDQYDRIDYILVSRGMAPELVAAKTRVVINPLTYKASDHRPALAVFKAREMAGQDLKPLATPPEPERETE
jgi:endonuclease/exonuclease/phosphatase family metal-dependent hydrolase